MWVHAQPTKLPWRFPVFTLTNWWGVQGGIDSQQTLPSHFNSIFCGLNWRNIIVILLISILSLKETQMFPNQKKREIARPQYSTVPCSLSVFELLEDAVSNDDNIHLKTEKMKLSPCKWDTISIDSQAQLGNNFRDQNYISITLIQFIGIRRSIPRVQRHVCFKARWSFPKSCMGSI